LPLTRCPSPAPSPSPCARRFSFDEMLSLKGNTAVYLQYAHARIAGIVRKAGRDLGEPRALLAGPAPCMCCPTLHPRGAYPAAAHRAARQLRR
jgi:hypothetical protein